MPRYNVEHNGKWASFSSISDEFITGFTDKSEYEEWRKRQYGEVGYKPAERCNLMTMREAVLSIRLNRTHDEALECLLDSGLSETECRQILDDMEAEYYCPIPKDNGKFECPNCHREVEREQNSCEGDDCCLDFVWRSV
jgi:hypothetical protein